MAQLGLIIKILAKIWTAAMMAYMRISVRVVALSYFQFLEAALRWLVNFFWKYNFLKSQLDCLLSAIDKIKILKVYIYLHYPFEADPQKSEKIRTKHNVATKPVATKFVDVSPLRLVNRIKVLSMLRSCFLKKKTEAGTTDVIIIIYQIIISFLLPLKLLINYEQ